jgi:hypothetical protein
VALEDSGFAGRFAASAGARARGGGLKLISTEGREQAAYCALSAPSVYLTILKDTFRREQKNQRTNQLRTHLESYYFSKVCANQP